MKIIQKSQIECIKKVKSPKNVYKIPVTCIWKSQTLMYMYIVYQLSNKSQTTGISDNVKKYSLNELYTKILLIWGFVEKRLSVRIIAVHIPIVIKWHSEKC